MRNDIHVKCYRKQTQTDWMRESGFKAGGDVKMSVIQLQADVSMLGSFFFHATQTDTQMSSKWKTVSAPSAIYKSDLT